MIKICKANPIHVQGIAKVCSDGYRATYGKCRWGRLHITEILSSTINNRELGVVSLALGYFFASGTVFIL
jgi:hypothetical protein